MSGAHPAGAGRTVTCEQFNLDVAATLDADRRRAERLEAEIARLRGEVLRQWHGLKFLSDNNCEPLQRHCVICHYGPGCGPFYGIQRLDMDREQPCPCACHKQPSVKEAAQALQGRTAMRKVLK